MKVVAASFLAADGVSRSIDDSEFVLERLATSSTMNSNPASVGSGGCSRRDEAPLRTLHLLVDPRSVEARAVAIRTDLLTSTLAVSGARMR
jgi:hypothetical protein